MCHSIRTVFQSKMEGLMSSHKFHDGNENDDAQIRTESPPRCFAQDKNGSGLVIPHLTKSLSILFLCLLLPLAGCTLSDKVDDRNFAVDAYSPTPNEIQLAQQRAQHYWQKNSQRFKNPTRYLAVPATSVLQGDVVQNLYPKLILPRRRLAILASRMIQN